MTWMVWKAGSHVPTLLISWLRLFTEAKGEFHQVWSLSSKHMQINDDDHNSGDGDCNGDNNKDDLWTQPRPFSGADTRTNSGCQGEALYTTELTWVMTSLNDWTQSRECGRATQLKIPSTYQYPSMSRWTNHKSDGVEHWIGSNKRYQHLIVNRP